MVHPQYRFFRYINLYCGKSITENKLKLIRKNNKLKTVRDQIKFFSELFNISYNANS